MAREPIHLAVVAAALTDDVRQAPRVARTLGFSGVQFDACAAAFNVADLTASGRREFRRLLSGQDQQFVGLRADLGPRGFAPGADVDRLLAQLGRVMEAAAELAAPLICLDLGSLPQPPRTVRPKPTISPELAGLILVPAGLTPHPRESEGQRPESQVAPPDPAVVSQVSAALQELGRLADRFSVVVAGRSDLASFAALEESLRQASCPWFGIDLDPAAVLRDEWEMDEIFARLGPLTRHVRGRDAVRGADRRTRPAAIGKGDTDWPKLLADLDSAGYHGWVTVDPVDLPDRSSAAAAALTWLSPLR